MWIIIIIIIIIINIDINYSNNIYFLLLLFIIIINEITVETSCYFRTELVYSATTVATERLGLISGVEFNSVK